MENRKLEILKTILNNAGEIQHELNVFNSIESCEGDFYGNFYRITRNEINKVIIICYYYDDYFDIYKSVELSHSTSMFILKGRNLKSGLSSPMARYHAWNYINKHGQKEATQEVRTYVRRHKKGER